MTTATTTSQARQVAERLDWSAYIGGPPAPSMVSGTNYHVGYYSDKSILICATGHEPIVLDEERTYYRDTVEHLARCLGMFSKVQRASMLHVKLRDDDTIWIDGILWNRDGSFNRV
jgi:hypothetical protein